MRLSKFLLLIASITMLCLLHVYQQTEIFRFAYLGQKKLVLLQDLLDKNAILRYNIEKDGSLIHICSRISEGADFQMPDTYRLVRMKQPKEMLAAKPVSHKENILSRLFGITRQAEAKTINP
jgi:hypothetical protein